MWLGKVGKMGKVGKTIYLRQINPFPMNPARHKQEKLLDPLSSMQSAFSSQGMSSQSSVVVRNHIINHQEACIINSIMSATHNVHVTKSCRPTYMIHFS